MYVFIIFSSVQVSEWLPIGGIAAHSAYDMSSWYNYLSVILVFFSPLSLWSWSFFLIVPFHDHCLLVPFCSWYLVSTFGFYIAS